MNGDNLLSTKRVALGLGIFLFLAFIGPAVGTMTFFYRDFGSLGYPTVAYHHTMFWRGELPLWNPYSNCGVPFLAQWGTMVLYPFSLIYCLLPLPWSLNVFCLLHLWWGAVGMFILAERSSGSKPGAAVASVVFLFNGLTLSSLAWPNYAAAFAWMPWIVFFAGDAWRTGGRAMIRAAVAGTLQMLTGTPELTLLTWMLVAALWAVEMSDANAPRKQMVIRPALVILMIVGLSAAQLFPFFELASLSQRAPGLSTKWGLPASALGNFVLPMLHTFQNYQGIWLQNDQTFLSSTYLGAAALLLAAFGLIHGERKATVLGVVSFVCVLLAFGGAWQKLPIVGLARFPVKFVLLLPLTVSLLVAIGIRAIEEKKISAKDFLKGAGVALAVCCGLLAWTRTHPLPYDWWPATLPNSLVRLGFFAAAAGLIYFWMQKRRMEFLAALLVILFVDGRWHLQKQNPITATETLRAAVGTRPLPKLGEGRLFISREAEAKLLRSRVRDIDQDFIGRHLAVWSHLNLIELAPKVNGSATLQLRGQSEIQDRLYEGTNVNVDAWLDFLGVTHITASGSLLDFTNRTTALPLVRAAMIESSSSYPLRAPVLLPSAAEIKNLQIKEHEITMKVSAREPNAGIIIAQSWHPAWKAEVNGKPLEGSGRLTRVNHAFQGLAVPLGESTVRIYYRDDWFIRGTTVSLLTMLVSFVCQLRRSRLAGRRA